MDICHCYGLNALEVVGNGGGGGLGKSAPLSSETPSRAEHGLVNIDFSSVLNAYYEQDSLMPYLYALKTSVMVIHSVLNYRAFEKIMPFISYNSL